MGLQDLKPIEQSAGGVLVRLKIQPRASRSEVAGLHANAVRIRLCAPPVDGAANDALLRFLAERVSVPRTAIRLVSGQSSRSKVALITGVDPERVRQALGL